LFVYLTWALLGMLVCHNHLRFRGDLKIFDRDWINFSAILSEKYMSNKLDLIRNIIRRLHYKHLFAASYGSWIVLSSHSAHLSSPISFDSAAGFYDTLWDFRSDSEMYQLHFLRLSVHTYFIIDDFSITFDFTPCY
jgi:hypothetical protein